MTATPFIRQTPPTIYSAHFPKMSKRIRKPSWKVKENLELEEANLLEKLQQERKRKEAEESKKLKFEDKQAKAELKLQEKLEARRNKIAKARTLQYQLESPEKRQERLQYLSLCQSSRLQDEKPEQREERLHDLSQRWLVRLHSETTSEQQHRLENASESRKRMRGSLLIPPEQKLEDNIARKRVRASRQPQQKLEENIARKRVRDSRPPEQKLEDNIARQRMRDSRTLEDKLEENIARKRRRREPQDMQDALKLFAAAVKEGPDYVCTCCHRLMYRKTVVEFKPTKYTKLSEDLFRIIFPAELMYTSMQGKVWVCKTCHNTLKRGKMPAQAKANNMQLQDVPPELSDLNPMEVRLISLRIPFMKMVALPCGKQRAIHGPAVNVPTDLHPVCDLLPRLPSQAQLVPMKLKRKLCYKGHYMYDFVRPAKVMAALEWLKANNPLYKDVDINARWEEHAAQDDSDLWEAFSSQRCQQPSQEPLNSNQPQVNVSLSRNSRTQADNGTPIDDSLATLISLARQRKFTVKDVSHDGNCLFSAVQLQLQKIGIQLSHDTLRQQVVAYLQDHPYTHDGSTHLRQFIAPPRDATDSGSLHMDTEVADEEDRSIESVQDLDTRLQLRWCKYLRAMRSTAWGDHVAVQGLADMLHVDIDILATMNPNTEPIRSCHSATAILHLGLIGQFHYMSLDDIDTDQQPTTSQADTSSPASVPSEEAEHSAINASEEDRERAEDDAAFHHQAQLKGLPYDSVMQREDVDVSADNVFSIAPSEGQKPIAILTDEHFEEMCNPTKYPHGSFGLTANREKKLTVRKFFNQRLLDADGRFAKDVEYLLTAQYAVESKQVSDDASIVLRQSQGRLYRGKVLTAGSIKDQSVLLQMMQRDDAYRFMKNVRGSPAYFQRVMYDMLAMIRQLGIPTWFFTLSAADMQWPDVIQAVARQYGHIFTDEQVAAMSFEEKSKWLRQNPVTAARHFQYRLDTFVQRFLKSKAHPIGEIQDYSIRIEFQARGSPHSHTAFWIKGAPKLGVNSDQEVCDFIDRYVHCNITEDDEILALLVSKLQKHRHSGTCRRNGRCRFNYPRPPSSATVIAREASADLSAERVEEIKAALLTVKKTLDDKDTPDDITLEELLLKAGVSMDTYVEALMICSRGNSVVLKRAPSESWINSYNPCVIVAWKGNMDIQFILDPYACVVYITSYMLKSEAGMSELLKQVCRECRGEDIRVQLRRIQSVFLNHREVSAQETAYRILSLPLKQMSRMVIFINTSPKEERVSLLKPASQLEKMEDDSEDIYHTSLIDRYAARPNSLNNMCLAEFAANYITRSGTDLHDCEPNDTLPPPEEEDRGTSTRIQLKNGLGVMYKRTREAVIRFHRFNQEKEASKMYRSKIMLYLPWRNESTDLLGGYVDFRSHCDDKSDDILANEQKYSHNAALISDAMDDLAQHGPPQHAWNLVAPGAAEQQARDEAQGVEVERSIEQEDLDANARLVQQQQHGAPVIQRYTAETNRELLSPEEYRAAMRGLNTKQRQIMMFHRAWCKRALIALKTGQPVTPYRVFLSGPGGVGKSHVISLIRNDTVKLLRLSGQVQPDDVVVLLTAPTGVAAVNIEGMTLHSALLLGTSKSSNLPLTQDKLNTLRTKLSNLQLLIIDEVSMVGSNMLLQIHRRLQQLKGSKDGTTFGNVSILAVGDLYQLQPVAQPYVFAQVDDLFARLHGSGSLWVDEFLMVELDEIMRQRGDQKFAELLCRLRKGECTEEDLDILRSRQIEDDDPEYPHEAVHVYRLNRDVDEDNISKLNQLAPVDQQVVIHAIDKTKDKHTRQLDMAMPKSKANTGGLVGELHLAVGAKVMLTVNIDVSDGLVNGARGTAEDIIKTGNEVTSVLVKFNTERVGISAISHSHYRNQHPHAVPISRHEAWFNIGRNKAAEVSRRQFPLVLAWACTIHKVQGMTLIQIVVQMKGQAFSAGQAYVAFSRVKTLKDLFIKNFNPASIKVSEAVVSEMQRLASNLLLPQPVPQVVSLPPADWLKIGHLNIRSYIAKLDDVTSDQSVRHADIMCFTETFLKSHHHVDSLTLNGNSSVLYRCDRATASSADVSGGGVMIACSSSLLSQSTGTPHPPSLEIQGITVTTCSGLTMCVVAVYRRPQLAMTSFLSLLENYLGNIPHQTMPTVIIGDFNDNLLSCSSSSTLLQFMSSLGFSQLVDVPTTDSGSLLDHIYCNLRAIFAIDVVDTYYSDHNACFCAVPLST